VLATRERKTLRWLVVTIIVVCGAFAATFFSTGDIWNAMFAAGIPACIFIAGLLFRFTRQLPTRRQRVLVLVLAAVALTGAAGHWVVMHSMTRWQHNEICVIRDRIQRSMMVSAMFDRATPAFAEYHRQRFPENRTMTEVFAELHPAMAGTAGTVMLDSLDGGVKVFAKNAWNSVVVLTSVGGVGRGTDPEFRNIDGRSGYLQACLRLTPEGMVYEIQN
jgi:hypothetical protein